MSDVIAIKNKGIPNIEFYSAHSERLKRITSEYFRDGNEDIKHAIEYAKQDDCQGADIGIDGRY